MTVSSYRVIGMACGHCAGFVAEVRAAVEEAGYELP